MDQSFTILGQIIQSPEQQYFLTRLLGFTFKIVYKKGKDNAAADALLRLLTTEMEEEVAELKKLTSSMISNWADRIADENKSDTWIQNIKEEIKLGKADTDYSVRDGILYFREKFCIGPDSELRSEVFEELHNSRIEGHSGYYRTLRRIRQNFFWKGMNTFVRKFVAACSIC